MICFTWLNWVWTYSLSHNLFMSYKKKKIVLLIIYQLIESISTMDISALLLFSKYFYKICKKPLLKIQFRRLFLKYLKSSIQIINTRSWTQFDVLASKLLKYEIIISTIFKFQIFVDWNNHDGEISAGSIIKTSSYFLLKSLYLKQDWSFKKSSNIYLVN